jgi:hypothetical protein
MPESSVRRFARLALVAACLPLGGLFLAGCGGGVEEKTLMTEEAPEIQSANNAMADYMKNQGKAAPAK